MRKSSILRLCLCLAVALFELPLMAQGVVVYQKNGVNMKYPYEQIDSIVTYNSCENTEGPITPPSTTPEEVEAVDLGLSVKWASCNVGATSPEEHGGFYAWGETEEKFIYDWSTYRWCKGSYNTQIKYCSNSSFGTIDNKITLEPEDDVAHIKWGGSWRMPTLDEINELITRCSWQWASVKGVNGYIVTGVNGNSIFLPAAGYRFGECVDLRGFSGRYWSATFSEYYSFDAYSLLYNDGGHECYSISRYNGHNVRPVTE